MSLMRAVSSGFGRWGLWTCQHRLGALADGRVNLLQRCDEVGEETSRVAIVLVERKPGDFERRKAEG